MSGRTYDRTRKNDNKIEDDELENAFLDDCNIDDLPLPNPELTDYQIELREVMKSGCNLQIAEYALIKLKIKTEFEKLKENYNKEKKSIMDELQDNFDSIFNEIKEGEGKQNQNDISINENRDKNKDKENDIEKYYEEVDEIMATKLLEKQEIQGIDINLLKKKLLEKFEEILKSSDNREKLLEARENYLKKREAIIEAALRIVKKIVNDENEYKKFEKEYLKRNK